ncbi:MAG: hypothetical protein M0R76_07170 [Proteobacteria bacterium]|nr:hypothetical protein [Pseudomonadota bacterium]
MSTNTNRRGQHRRYADRRIAALLQIHEIFFYEPPGLARQEQLIQAIQSDYETDRGALLVPDAQHPHALRFLCRSGDWGPNATKFLSGSGITALRNAHSETPGALTLSRFRSTSLFSDESWNALWHEDLLTPASALLSVNIAAPTGESLGWLLLALNGASREWSSHDRDLAEEIALLLAQAMQRGII